MAPLPKRRHSSRRGGKRQAALKLRLGGLVKCPQCGNLKLPHRVCQNCGYYEGKPIIVKRAKPTKEK